MKRNVLTAAIVFSLLVASNQAWAESGEAGALHTMGTPCRLFDSRTGFGQIPSSGLVVLDVRHSGWVYGSLAALLKGASEPLPAVRSGLTYQVEKAVRPSSEECTIPDDASHVLLVVAAVNASAAGNVKPLWSNGLYSTLANTLMNYGPNLTAGNTSTLATIPLCGESWGDCDQDFGLYNAGSAAIDLVIDLYGWYE